MDVKLTGSQEVREFSQARIAAGDAEEVDGNGRTLLYLAAYMNDTGLIRKLLAHGLKADRPDNRGVTARDIALQYDCLEALTLLRSTL